MFDAFWKKLTASGDISILDTPEKNTLSFDFSKETAPETNSSRVRPPEAEKFLKKVLEKKGLEILENIRKNRRNRLPNSEL